MDIAVFGLGYVGAVSVACLAEDGHNVIGVDPNEEKVSLVNEGRSPIIEPGLEELLGKYTGKTIHATTQSFEAVSKTAIAFISVGTPTAENGEPNLSYVYGVCKQIAHEVIKSNKDKFVIILRSTVPPGTVDKCKKITDEITGDSRIKIGFNPEFLREGTAVKDYYNPAYTIIGSDDEYVIELMKQVYHNVPAPFYATSVKVAEMVKYVANTWHAAKIVFANEIGRLSHELGISGNEVMDIIVKDTKLNVSPVYMKPGFAYGGSCLPKDVRGMMYLKSKVQTDLPMIDSIERSNEVHIDAAFRQVLKVQRNHRVILLGLAFKPNTDDLRESPSVKLAKKLIGEGVSLRIYDPYVKEAFLLGTNLQYIRNTLPHFERLLITQNDLEVKPDDVLVVAYKCAEFVEILNNNKSNFRIDLSGNFNF